MPRDATRDDYSTFRETSQVSILMALLLVVLGTAALILPEAVSIAVSILILWLIVFSGVAHLVHAWDTRREGAFVWRLLVGTAYIVGGIYLLLHPKIGLEALTLLLVALFLFESAMLFGVYLWLPRLPGSGWVLADASSTLLIALLIWMAWPSSSVWAIGVLAGVNILVSGLTRFMIGWRQRKHS